MSARTLFVTGTDTGVGKTRISAALVRYLRSRGERACGYKPVASGCERSAEGLRNDDALALWEAGGRSQPYEAINPVALEPAIAPHLAARAAGIRIDPVRLDAAYEALAAANDWIVVEGAGGWYVPYDGQRTAADWVAAHHWPVLLVVGFRLGCLNHALLTAEAVQSRTLLLGWAANVLPPAQPWLEENVADLCARLRAPQLAYVPAGGTLADEDAAGIVHRLTAASLRFEPPRAGC